ncbi:hypothetical protein [Planococcus wigleyi]|uniref:Uncharacterized protein n=1 Tax=Planococcus wigleyi TaxID=2762216 RepID=A0ABR8W9Z6_9BACL|nr:hypothetical protein [Planococcus wigleyi]MBD8013853.1 hypothetical protein [Planococcus wigleyi]
MKIDPARKYVLLSVKWTKNTLVFWGSLTDDNEKCSYGGYTDDIDSCERYTLEEIKNESSYFYEYGGEPFYKLKKMEQDGTWAIRVDELDKLGRKSTCYLLN